MKRYRVESRVNKYNYFKVDCDEKDLEYHKALCKYNCFKNGGVCYYREFPVTKNEKIFYAKDSFEMTIEELTLIRDVISSRLEKLNKG